MSDELLTRRQAARLLSVHEDTVSRLVQDGQLAAAVIERRGRGGALRLSRAAVETYVAVAKNGKALDPGQERARKDRLAGDLSEFKLEIERGKFVLREDAERAIAALIAGTRSSLLNLPNTLTAKLVREYALHGEPGMYEAVEAAVHEALTQLASRDWNCAECPGCGFDMLAPPVVDAGICGAPTRSGGACQNRAKTRCHLHRETT